MLLIPDCAGWLERLLRKDKGVKRVELLRELCAIPALSGSEEPMIRRMRAAMSRSASDVRVDRLGNVLAVLPAARPDAPTALVMAHIDELGFVVRKIEDDGFVRVHRLGGVPERVLAGQLVAIQAGDNEGVIGVIGLKSHHVTPPEEKYQVVPVERVYVDAGFHSKAEALAAGIRIGTPVTYAPFFGQRNDVVMSKTLDDRLGCVVLLELLEQLKGEPLNVHLACAATVHEEFTGRGAAAVAAQLNPAWAIAVDVAVACDTPDLGDLSEIGLRKGPVVNTYTFHPRGPLIGTLPNPLLRDRLIATAEARNLPYQLGTFFGGLTDASYTQYVGLGVPSVEVGIPTRYTHAPVEVASMQDVDSTLALLTAFLREIPADFSLARG